MNIKNFVSATLLSITLGLTACGQEKTGVGANNGLASAEQQSNSIQESVSETATKKAKKAIKEENTAVIEPVDINTATAEELIKALKGTGVGAAKVAKIIEYRSQNNGFKSIDELTEVKGIGEKTLEKMRSRLKLSNVKGSDSKVPTNKKVNKNSDESE